VGASRQYALAGWISGVAVHVFWTWIVVSGMDAEPQLRTCVSAAQQHH
jgi:hypothetical protein